MRQVLLTPPRPGVPSPRAGRLGGRRRPGAPTERGRAPEPDADPRCLQERRVRRRRGARISFDRAW